VPMRLRNAEGNTRGRVIASAPSTRRGRRPWHVRTTPLARSTLSRQTPEVEAECLNRARSVLCGGPAAMRVPTANDSGDAPSIKSIISDERKPDMGDAEPSAESGNDMHIHKPKPLHGIREFLSEIGVIVAGVLIALGLEQAVESLHWSHKVEQTEVRLRADLKKDRKVVAWESKSDRRPHGQ
jgi:hypothetical protein